MFQAAAGVPDKADLSLHRLLDGSLALRQDGKWTLAFPAGSTAARPAPDWLASSPNTTLSIIRGGRGHALFFDNSPSGCGQVHAAIFTPSGKRCGGLLLPMPAGSCPQNGDSGFDGTAIVAGSNPGSGRCLHSYWPGLLR